MPTTSSGLRGRRTRGKRLALSLGAAALLAPVAVTVAPREAAAQQRIYNGWYYRSLVVGRANPIGLIWDLRAGYRIRFNQGTSETFLQNQHIAFSPTLITSPAFIRPGFMVEALPLSVLYLFAQYEYVQYFGTFNIPNSFDRPMGQNPSLNEVGHTIGDPPTRRVGYSDQALRDYNASPDPNVRPYLLGGHQVTLGATFQIRLGDLAIRSAQRWMYFNMNTRNGADGRPQPYFYDITMDILAPSNGWVFANDTDFLYILPFGLTFGARYSAVHAWHDLNDATVSAGTTTPISRLGPIVTFQFYERRRSWFNAPTILLAAQWWLHHPYRTGNLNANPVDNGNPGIPYILFGLLWRGDL